MLSKLTKIWTNRASLSAIAKGYHRVFSQYGEDLLLEFLMHPGNAGTYVDVGANHPIDGSNTFGLYLRGWSGVTIEPNPMFAPLFRKHRARDAHVVEGVAEREDHLTYYDFADHKYNTFSAERAEQLSSEGTRPIGTRPIRCRSLRSVIEECLGTRPIDLMSVDCEGLDLVVLKSADLDRFRPTVLIVENYDRFRTFRNGTTMEEFDRFLRAKRYSPIAQAGYSSIHVADDWRDLVRRSPAYDPARLDLALLPG